MSRLPRTRPWPWAPLVLGLAASAALSGCAGGEEHDRQPVATISWNQSHRVDLPTGWSVTARNVGRTDESTSLAGPDGKGCLVSTWSSKPERHSRPRWARTVSVHGHKAAYGDLDPDYGLYPRAVLWEDADNGWLRVSCDLDRAGILGVAEGVRSAENPVRVPFKLSAMPDGLSMVQLIESTEGGATPRVAAQFEMAGSARPLVMQISNELEARIDTGPVEKQTIGGRTVEIRPASQTICLSTKRDPVCVFGPADEPATDWSPQARRVALRTAELLTPIDDPNDRTSWLDADEALPR
jgi:hypothetical protein